MLLEFDAVLYEGVDDGGICPSEARSSYFSKLMDRETERLRDTAQRFH